jgi:hypothetical protein
VENIRPYLFGTVFGTVFVALSVIRVGLTGIPGPAGSRFKYKLIPMPFAFPSLAAPTYFANSVVVIRSIETQVYSTLFVQGYHTCSTAAAKLQAHKPRQQRGAGRWQQPAILKLHDRYRRQSLVSPIRSRGQKGYFMSPDGLGKKA